VVTFRATQLNVTPLELPPARIAGWDDATASPEVVPVPAAAPAAAGPAAEVAAAPDAALVAAGEKAWRQCAACHKVGEGARNGTGPVLNGVVGRQAGTGAGFRYSPQMVAAGQGGLIWTAEALDAFLADPAKTVPRNRMSFRGVRDPAERAGLIAYLSTFAD
jgi:cytochrome c